MKTAHEFITEKGGKRSYSALEVHEMLGEYADQFKPKWIPIEQKLPELPDQYYLISVKNKNKTDGIQIIDMANWDGEEWIRFHTWEKITHWMPLP